MAHFCKYPDCTNPVFGGGYCRWHQSSRLDKKPSPIKRETRSKARRQDILNGLDRIINNEIDRERKHVCAYCDKVIYSKLEKHNFDHVLEKAIYPSLRHKKFNIVITCWQCHQVKTSNRYTQRMEEVILKVADFFIRQGLLIEIGAVDVYRQKDWIMEKKEEG